MRRWQQSMTLWPIIGRPDEAGERERVAALVRPGGRHDHDHRVLARPAGTPPGRRRPGPRRRRGRARRATTRSARSATSSSTSRTSRWGTSSRRRPSRRGQQLHRHRLEGPDGQPSAGAGLELVQLLHRHRQPVQHRLGVAEQEAPRRGERRRAGPAGAVEDRRADRPLERRDLLADRGLAEAEDVTGAAERAFLGHRGEGDEVAGLDVGGGRHVHKHNRSPAS